MLDQLVTLFWERGFAHTSHDDMKTATGLSGSSLYNTFGDKHQIFDRVLERYHEMSAILVEPLIEGTGGLGDVLTWIDMLKTRVGSAKTPLGCLMIATMGARVGQDPQVRHRTQQNVARVGAALVSALRRAADRGELDRAAIRPRGAMLLAGYVGVLTASRGAPSPETALDMLDGLRDSVGEWMRYGKK